MKPKLTLLAVALTLISLVIPFGQVAAQEVIVEIEVIDQPRLVFDGDIAAVAVQVANVGGSTAFDVKVLASTGEERVVGTLIAGVQQTVTLFIENYVMGENEVEIYATYSGGETDPWLVVLEVRPEIESVTLRVIDAPATIYEGTVFTAQLEVQNLWQQAVSGTRIRNGDDVLYYVGALTPNQSIQINLRLDEYDIGINSLKLVAEHERGSGTPLPLEFEVIPAEAAVKVYLTSLSTATYLAETLELTLAIAASEDAEVSELELIALDDGIQPAGYYLGSQVAAEEEIQVIDVQSLLTGGQDEEEAESDRLVRGRELTFSVSDIAVGTEPIRFRISYRLGKSVVQQDFTVDATVVQAPGMQLIQAERVVSSEEDEAVVTLHVANDLPVKADAVSVVPVGDFEASPSAFFIGGMAPDDFLPAFFRVSTEDLEDGDELFFKVVYRIGRDTYESEPLRVVLNIEESNNLNPAAYIIPIIIVVIVVLLLWFLRRRRWTQ